MFRGHPVLIQGFNTFLPPGYRIECSSDPSDPNPIRVTTPTGTTTRSSYSHDWDLANGSRRAERVSEPLNGQQPPPQAAAHAAAAANGGQIEFNHAISYVNKIKTRFANQPDIYKQFLEILQTYQREQKPISDVYEQVTLLFSNSPDLLDDFKQFLPDTSNMAFGDGLAESQQDAEYYDGVPLQLPPVGNFQSQGASGILLSPESGQHAYGYNNNSASNGQAASVHAAGHMMDGQPAKAVHDAFGGQEQVSNVRGSVVAPAARRSRANSSTVGLSGKHSGSEVAPAVVNATLVPGIPEPVPPGAETANSSLTEEIAFFDRVKRAIGNKQTYNEFLKLLNLFSQDVIDKATLVARVDSFIGDAQPDLMSWFKAFVGFEDKPQRLENVSFKKHQLELSLCKAYGPSYRQLPKAETFLPCSGRDEMCWEVLNDEWVGHPTWGSEDSGFTAHRKNQYEEILFKIEEERLEFDYHIESNLRTIQILETIANRLANMTREQKLNFKLPPGLGHNSTTIYKKVIRKIYDKDRGFEVIDALHENPAVAVPIVLKRLKQKDEEWKRAHREWNKVWREMEQKVFFKSLDHLGLTFKQADKKLLTVKQLVSEISTVKVEQQHKRLHPLTPKPQEQLNYTFKDYSILVDILKLVDLYINKCSNYSASDREKMMSFFQSFVNLMFGVNPNSIQYGPVAVSVGTDLLGNSNDASSNDALSASKKRTRDTDLLRDVLKRQNKSKKDDAGDSPRNRDPDSPELSEQVEKSKEIWIETNSSQEALSRDGLSALPKRDRYNFFCNTTIYVFFRHLRTLYERLEEIKAMDEIVSQEIRSRKFPQFAKDLNLISHQLDDMGIEIDGTKNCYLQVLNLSEKLMEGEIEHQWFEETIRQGYNNKAYKIYTIDKVVQSLVKHMHSIVSDSRASDMIVLFESDRQNTSSTAKDQILYRLQVRSLMTPEENMFNIMYKDKDESVISIQFVGLDDLTINDHESNEEKYNYYVTSYIMSHPTEGVPASKITMPFIKSFIDSVDEEQCEGQFALGLKVSICENSYRLFFNAGTLDVFTASLAYQKPIEDGKKRQDKLKALRATVENPNHGWRLMLEDEKMAEELTATTKLLLERSNLSGTGDATTIEKPSASIESSQVAQTLAGDADATTAQDTTINETTLGDSTMPQEDVTMSP